MTKTPAAAGLPRYQDAVRRFRIEDEIARLHGDPASGINAYLECCGRYTGQDRLALRAISAGGDLRKYIRHGTSEDAERQDPAVPAEEGGGREAEGRIKIRVLPGFRHAKAAKSGEGHTGFDH